MQRLGPGRGSEIDPVTEEAEEADKAHMVEV